MSESIHDRWMNDQLRRVPLPEGLLARLKEIAAGDDSVLDEMLRGVALPENLLARLKSLPLETEEQLDEQLRDVPVPARLSSRLKRIAEPVERSARPRRRRISRAVETVVAASLLVGISLAYMAAMATLMMSAYGVAYFDAPPTLVADSEQPIELEGGHVEMVAVVPDLTSDRADPGPFAPPSWLADIDHDFKAALVNDDPHGDMDRVLDPASGRRVDLGRHVHWSYLFAARRERDSFRRLETAEGVRRRGIEPPRVAQFDWEFFTRHGLHPFTVPARSELLHSQIVPLGSDTGSFDHTLRRLDENALPDQREIFVEDFLAAFDYHFPPPREQALGIRVAAGPSPFGDPARPVQLLQVAAQAAVKTAQPRQPTRLVVAVDVSASMHWGGRLEMTRQALLRLTDRLAPEDRVSLVAFSEQASVLVEDAGPDELDLLRAKIDSLRPESSTNFGAGIKLACSLAMEGPSIAVPSRRVLLVTDGLPELPAEALSQIRRIARDARADGISLAILDLGGDDRLDPRLDAVARDGAAQVHRAVTSGQVRWAALESLTGRSEVVAADVRMKVRFNPQAVLAYRLVGHDPGVVAADVEADLHSGQAATGLFELVLIPDGPLDVGQVELTWRDPASGRVHRRVQPISRLQFATAFYDTALSLQLASLVAETAEVLRGSPFADGNSLEKVLQQAEQVHPRLEKWDTFGRFLGLCRRAAAAKLLRDGVRRTTKGE